MAIPIIGALIDGVKDIVSEVVVDKDKRDQINLQLAQLEDQAQARLDAQVLAQIEVNKVEAASGSVFVAGWRPAVGWVGAAALALTTIVIPLFSWIASVVFGYNGGYPIIDGDILLYTLGGMLGIGAQRTYEKVKGVSTNDMRDTPTRVQQGSTNVEVSQQGAVSVETKGATNATAPAAPVKAKKKKFLGVF